MGRETRKSPAAYGKGCRRAFDVRGTVEVGGRIDDDDDHDDDDDVRGVMTAGSVV